MSKDERLLNLIALLLNTRRPLTVEEIRHTVPGYQQEDYASFKRMFERDKEELRSAGIPLDMRPTDAWDVEEGYFISKDRYYLPELDLTAEEYAALWMASRMVVEDPSTKEDRALIKLEMGAGSTQDPGSPPWLRARLHLDAPSLPIMLEAVAGNRSVKFAYRATGRTSDKARTIDPYGLIHRQGAWYVAGFDHARKAVVNFKLARITSPVTFAKKSQKADFEVPDDFTLEGRITQEFWAGEEGVAVEVGFSQRIAWLVQRTLNLEPVGEWKDRTVLRMQVTDEEGFLSWVIGFGEDAVVRSPARIKQALVERLKALVPA